MVFFECVQRVNKLGSSIVHYHREVILLSIEGLPSIQCFYFRFQNVAGRDLNIFLEACDNLLIWIEKTSKLISNNRPHPIDEDALHEYKEKLKVGVFEC